MKVTFKRDYSYWPAWLPVAAYFLLAIVAFIMMGMDRGDYYLLMMPVAFVFYFVVMIRKPFHLTYDNKLSGNGFIDVGLINKLEKKNKGVTVYFFGQMGKRSENVSFH